MVYTSFMALYINIRKNYISLNNIVIFTWNVNDVLNHQLDKKKRCKLLMCNSSSHKYLLDRTLTMTL